MRIRLIFNVKNPGGIIPFNHQHILSKAFRFILKSHFNNSEISEEYNFSAIKGKLIAIQNGMEIHSSKATIVFSSANEIFLKLFLELLQKEKFINIGTVFLEFSHAEIEEVTVFDLNEYKYVCISPIVLMNPIHYHNEDYLRFIDPASDEFSDLLYENILNRLEELNICSEDEIDGLNKFQLVPDQSFINKANKTNKKFSRIFEAKINNQKMEVRGYTFPFTLYASEKIHDFIFTYGLGELCSNGLGMLDLADKNYTSRTIQIPLRKKRIRINSLV